LFSAGDRDYALMSVRLGLAIEFFSQQKAKLDSTGSTSVDNSLDPLVVSLARDAHVIKTART
jgi:hypothetical protein